MGACMYLRRELIARAGPFDVHLGPGAPRFKMADDTEFSHRALIAGCVVVRSPAIVVRHFGARQYTSGAVSRLIRDGTLADGAADMKLLRCGEAIAVGLIVFHAWSKLKRLNLSNLAFRRGPSGGAWIAMYLYGLASSFRLRVDRKRRLYLPAPEM